MAQKLRHQEAYEKRHGIPMQLTQTSRKCPGFVLFFIIRYYLRHEDDVFDTRHLDLFFDDVLDFFLGLHQTLLHTMD